MKFICTLFLSELVREGCCHNLIDRIYLPSFIFVLFFCVLLSERTIKIVLMNYCLFHRCINILPSSVLCFMNDSFISRLCGLFTRHAIKFCFKSSIKHAIVVLFAEQNVFKPNEYVLILKCIHSPALHCIRYCQTPAFLSLPL